MRPAKGTYPSYYDNYIPLVPNNDALSALRANHTEIMYFISSLPSSVANHAYAPGKWTVKQVINHITDTERILSYRALRFARKDPAMNLAFEENEYAANAELNNRQLNHLAEEFDTVRKATISLYDSFSDATLLNTGNTHIGSTTVLAVAYMICGHATHHANVIRDRYLPASKK